MKRVLTFLILLIPALSFAFDLDVGVRAAWLIPKSSTMREVYGQGIPEFQIELGIPLNRCMTVFGDFNTYYADGHSSQKHKSSVENYALLFGAKYYFQPWTWFRPYIGFGLGGGYVMFCDQSPYVKHHNDHFGFAYIGKIGTEVCFSRYLYLDLFADYSSYLYNFKNKKGLAGHYINAGGLKAGIGLCFRY